ncbi:hypothetical protein VE25_16795 [Devosia geojensis]|uniref:BrnT family toxin n=1 Tax=Devosia geojensis TaxID=443610 RepID=A0A0F5FPD0_9HYPH|nr:BrnT family toxin [Devosia geojensis]KKB10673.1 hypothetical protein VE25_16795 [Devosia geojensis]
MEFEWNEHKAATNRVKHRISFETATAVFNDPDEITEPSPQAHSEPRFQIIGQVIPGLVILVVFTYRGPLSARRVRLISARKASREERQRYYEQ